uniref:Uncharacterized protein n=1 Tax=Ditylenchus dipsaci TaxID=166011 RepID=A0A915EJT8_9BILA
MILVEDENRLLTYTLKGSVPAATIMKKRCCSMEVDTWISLGDFFCFMNYGRENYYTAESYHGKQRHNLRMRCKSGEWVVCFRELSNAEKKMQMM